MPMGFTGAPNTCQKMVNINLRGTHRFAGSLMDDILVYSRDFESHLKHTEDVLGHIKQAGLTVNAKKCTFATNNLRLFGHWLENGTISPDPEKVKVLAEWPIPKTKSQLKSFLGLCGLFRDYIEHYAAIACPLSDLLGKRKPDKIIWKPEHHQSFVTLKTALMSKPILRPPDMSKEFIIMADSSRTTAAAILMQRTDEESPAYYTISYASRKLLPNQTIGITRNNICAHEIPTLCLRKAHYHLQRPPASGIVKLLGEALFTFGKVGLWALLIQEYDITMKYIKGEQQLADCFTRLDKG